MKVVVVGSGAFGTALASTLSKSKRNSVFLLSRSKKQVKQINQKHINSKYLNGLKLNKHLIATIDREIIIDSDFVMLALPSKEILNFLHQNKNDLKQAKSIVNLSKGFGTEKGQLVSEIIYEVLGEKTSVCSLKGPTFANELTSSPLSAFTVAGNNENSINDLKMLFKGQNVRIDTLKNIEELEYLSILKNSYAIAIGIIEAKYTSSNLRAAVFTDSLAEIKTIVTHLVRRECDILKYAGTGDLLLTGLNDQSRNRTLGLMIGKSFIQPTSKTSSVVVEGFRSVGLLRKKLPQEIVKKLVIFDSLSLLLENKISVNKFINNVIKG